MSIFNIFRPSHGATIEATPPQPGVPGQPAQQPPAPQASQQQPQPQQQPQQPTSQEPPAPLESFKELWTPPKEGDPKPAGNFDPSAMFQIDPAKIQEAVGQMDFASTVTPETLAAITAGGEGAAQAFVQAMNGVARQAFAQSMVGASKLVETAMTKANASIDARLQEGIRRQQASASLLESNPALKHPAAAPIVSALEAQLAAKYPQHSPAEITRLATDYLAQFADLAKPAPKAATTPSNEMDWGKFLGE